MKMNQGTIYLGFSIFFPCISIVGAFFFINYCLRTYNEHYFIQYDAQPGDEVWSITGNLRSSDFTSDGSLTIDQITIINQDKPPSYNEDPPTYDQAISMARANNIPLPYVLNSCEEQPKPEQ